MTDLSAEARALAHYRPTHKVRFVTAASLFDGHDASINIIRRLLQQAGARELWEETGISIQPADLREFRVKSAPGGTTLLIFATAPALRSQDLPPFTPNEETQEICVLTAPQELAFSTHTEALREYFAGR